jgi:hypothetical protein
VFNSELRSFFTELFSLQSYPLDLEKENFNIIYNKDLVELLHCSIFSIKIKTVEVFGHLLQFGYSCTSETSQEVIKFQSKLFAKLDINRMVANVSYNILINYLMLCVFYDLLYLGFSKFFSSISTFY